jgi:hypothetical protein
MMAIDPLCAQYDKTLASDGSEAFFMRTQLEK